MLTIIFAFDLINTRRIVYDKYKDVNPVQNKEMDLNDEMCEQDCRRCVADILYSTLTAGFSTVTIAADEWVTFIASPSVRIWNDITH